MGWQSGAARAASPGPGALNIASPGRMLCRNAMPFPENPLSLPAGALPRLGWSALLAAALWAAVAWAIAA